jgi:hypothetical protein
LTTLLLHISSIASSGVGFKRPIANAASDC